MRLIHGPETEQLIDKLVNDNGFVRTDAEEWITNVVSEQYALPTHSCSCHVKVAGPCLICKELGCEVWDFNQVPLPLFDLGPDYGTFFIEPGEVVPSRERRPLIEHRRCERCGKTKPLNEECFNRKVKNKSGFRGVCKKCDKKD